MRDLMLRRPIGDLDVLLRDALEPVARATARRLGGRVVLRPSFRTATIVAAGVRLDLAAARSERYALPGALPEVRPASVDQDLGRRDFSVNAMALPLDRSSGASLLDPHEGAADLAARRIRVLHDSSFRDDPTRLLRASRYAARLGFRLHPRTARLAREAVRERALDTISGDRVLHELWYLLDEARPDRAARHTQRLGLFEALARGWRLENARPLLRLARAFERPPWPEAARSSLRRDCGLRLLLLDARASVRTRALQRIGVRGRGAAAIRGDLSELARLSRALAKPLTPGRLDAKLAGRDDTALLTLFCAARGPAARRVRRYASELRHTPNPIDGHRARALGAAGPEIGALLRDARTGALDGRAIDEAWLRRWLARRR